MRSQKVFATNHLSCRYLQNHRLRPLSRTAATGAKPKEEPDQKQAEKDKGPKKDGAHSEEQGEEEEEGGGGGGAMSRRLGEMAEESYLEGGKSARRNIQEAGFSDELKSKLEEKIAASSFKSEHAAAFSIADMPASAGKESRDTAASAPWTGTESAHDASLRMLNDASKPMRVPFKPPNPEPVPVNLKPSPKPRLSSGQRLAKARQRTSDYSMSQDEGLSEKEREAMRNEFRDRFTPGYRAMPVSPQGLSSLANERIEDAIAQGHFRDIPRGKGNNVERDHTADSPFLDTTEYLMNRVLQKQQVTPEWIQKQQELKLDIEQFRERLRADWRRHAARLIASQGGSLQTQIRRAKAYAAAEARQVGSDEHSLAEDAIEDDGYRTQIDHEGRITRVSRTPSSSSTPSPSITTTTTPSDATSQATSPSSPEPLPIVSPLRDPQYLSTEQQYHTLAIKKINDAVRSYNLQAPRVSQKGYLNLNRELDLCYAEVAPSLPEEIHRRATERAHDTTVTSSHEGPGSSEMGDMLGLKQKARVYDEDSSKEYGFKQLWKDIWGRKKHPDF